MKKSGGGFRGQLGIVLGDQKKGGRGGRGLLTIPGLVAVVLGLGVADEHVLERVRALVGRIGDLHDIVSGGLAEPSQLMISQDTGGLGCLFHKKQNISESIIHDIGNVSRETYQKILAPFIEDFLQRLVHIRIQEGRMSTIQTLSSASSPTHPHSFSSALQRNKKKRERKGGLPRGSHGVIQDRTHRHAHNTHALRRIRPLGRPRHDVVQHRQHVSPVADLPRPRRVLPVRVLARYLLEHLVEVHVDPRVALDQLLELLQRRRQLLARVGVDVLGGSLQEAVVDAVVCWEPGSRSIGNKQTDFVRFLQFSLYLVDTACVCRGDDLLVNLEVLGDVMVISVLMNHLDELANVFLIF